MQPTHRHSDHDHLHWLYGKHLWTVQGKNLLDLGCGSGFLLGKAIEDGAAAGVGVDIVLPNRPSTERIEFRNVDLNGNNWADDLLKNNMLGCRSFDYIFAFDIIEHLENPFQFLLQCRSLLKDSTASLILTTPNVNSWERMVRPNSWSGQRDPEHKILFSPYSLKFLLERCDLTVTFMEAPARKLGPLGRLCGVGGQIFCRSVVARFSPNPKFFEGL